MKVIKTYVFLIFYIILVSYEGKDYKYCKSVSLMQLLQNTALRNSLL